MIQPVPRTLPVTPSARGEESLGVVVCSDGHGGKGVELVSLSGAGLLRSVSELGPDELPRELSAPSYVVASPTGAMAYATDENRVYPSGNVFALRIDKIAGKVTLVPPIQPAAGQGTVHVSLDRTGQWLFAANFDADTVQVFPIGDDGTLGEASDTRRVGDQPHAIYQAPWGQGVFVPCLGADKIYQLTFDARSGRLSPNSPPAFRRPTGAGPRHLAFSPSGRLAYLIEEKRWDVVTLEVSLEGTLSMVEGARPVPALPGHEAELVRAGRLSCRASEVLVHPGGRLLLVTSRLDGARGQPQDGYAGCFSIGRGGRLAVGFFAKVGKEPRGCSLTPDGRHLVVANQRSTAGHLMAFSIDQAHGRLERVSSLTLPAPPMMLAFVPAR